MSGSREKRPVCAKKSLRVVEVNGRQIRVQETFWEDAQGFRFVAELRDYDSPAECAVVDGWHRAQFARTVETAIHSFAASLSLRKVGS